MSKQIYFTDEERLEAKRERARRYYHRNKEHFAKYRAENKESRKESSAKWRANNKEAQKEYKAKTYAEKTTHYVTYTHTNTQGDVYIGSGTNLRPYQFNSKSRSVAWHDAFSNDCEITIIAEFKDREDAFNLECKMIEETGINNLINKINAKTND